MSFYVQRGQVPPKRHTQFQRPDGALYTEEVLGEEGFHGIGSIAYHIHPPTLVDSVGEPEDVSVEYADEAFLAHRHFLGPKVEPGGDWLTGRDADHGQRRHRDVDVRPDGRDARGHVLQECDARRAGLRPRRRGHAAHRPRRRRVPPGRLRPRAADADPPLVVRRRPPAAAAGHGVADGVPAAQALPQRHGPAARAQPVLRTRLPAAGRAAGHRPGGAVHGQDQEAREAVPVRLPVPPLRRRRLGRVHVPDGVLDPRLRADHRAHPPAAAGPPDVRGARVRRVLVRPAPVRLPPGLDPGAVQPLQHRLRRGPVLRRGRLHVAEGDRAGQLHAPPRRHPARPAPGHDRGQSSARARRTSWR